MNKNIQHPDFIDAYLKHKLSETERLSFERQMQKDPLLQNEVNLQRDIVRSLAEVRKAELKARLNAIPLDTPVAWYGNVKWMAAALTALTIGVGAYLYFTPDTEEIQQTAVGIEEKTALPEKELAIEKPAPVEEFTVSEPSSSEAVSEKENSTPVAAELEKAPQKALITKEITNTAKKEVVKLPEIIHPDVVSDFDDDFQNKIYDDVVMPEKGLAQVDGTMPPEIEVENQQVAGYDFHYRYQDNKLYLYGDFKGNPYEILALNTEEKTRLFLKYDSSFYVINPSQSKIAPLSPITNQALINELKIVSEYK